MNVQIRRMGIAIKTVPVKGDRARIGSGEECEISLNDPYLAPVVAEVVRRGNEWYIADTGSSLEGVRRGDEKILEEVFEPGEPYVVGGFEIMREGVSRRTSAPRTLAGEAIPKTMYQMKVDPVPGTIVQSLHELRQSKPSADDTRSRLEFKRLPTSDGPHPPARPPARKSRIRVILLVAAVMFALLFLAVVIGSDSGSPPVATNPPAAPVQTSAAATTATATTATAPAAVPKMSGDEAALRLKIDDAVAAWEAELQRRDDPVVRRKIITASLEIGRAYAASGDPRAQAFLDRVIRYAPAGSAEAAIARERLALIQR